MSGATMAMVAFPVGTNHITIANVGTLYFIFCVYFYYFFLEIPCLLFLFTGTGDCEIVVCNKDGFAVLLTEEHSVHNPDELDRVRSEGARIIEDPYGVERLNGVLEITRAFGNSARVNVGVSSKPFVASYQIQGKLVE